MSDPIHLDSICYDDHNFQLEWWKNKQHSAAINLFDGETCKHTINHESDQYFYLMNQAWMVVEVLVDKTSTTEPGQMTISIDGSDMVTIDDLRDVGCKIALHLEHESQGVSLVHYEHGDGRIKGAANKADDAAYYFESRGYLWNYIQERDMELAGWSE